MPRAVNLLQRQLGYERGCNLQEVIDKAWENMGQDVTKVMFQVSRDVETTETVAPYFAGQSDEASQQNGDANCNVYGKKTTLVALKGNFHNGIRRKGRAGDISKGKEMDLHHDYIPLPIPMHDGPKLEGLQDLLHHTKFTREELQRMYRGFKNDCPSGIVDRETFKKIYAQFFPYGDSSQYAQYIFNVFDLDRDGKISFEDFVCGLSVSLHGTSEEKLKWVFKLYDIGGDGVLTKDELMTIVASVHNMLGGDEHQPPADDVSVEDQVSRLFEILDTNDNGLITEEEFVEGSLKDETIRKSLAVFDCGR